MKRNQTKYQFYFLNMLTPLKISICLIENALSLSEDIFEYFKTHKQTHQSYVINIAYLFTLFKSNLIIFDVMLLNTFEL